MMPSEVSSGQAQERRLAAIATAAAEAFRQTAYHQVRAEDVAERVRLPRKGERGGARSAVWLYNEVRSRRVMVALALQHAFEEFAAADPEPEPPETVIEAEAMVAAALMRIAAFHQTERFLVGQVRLGIGDISTSEKRPATQQSPPEWPDGPYGRAAESGWDGRVTAYARYLASRIAVAISSVAAAPESWAVDSAERLSEVAFRVMADDTGAAIERQAEALAAYWFERDVVPLTGEWVSRLRTAERAAALAVRDHAGGRVTSGSLKQVLHVLNEGTPLTARSIQVAAELTELLESSAEEGRPDDDVRLLCDVTSRHGLLLLRLGDPAGAIARLEHSREVAARLPDRDETTSYAARADHNIADALIALGRTTEGVELLAAVEATRTRRRPGEGAEAQWRRLTLTQQAAARAATRAGRVGQGVTRAEDVLRDRVKRLGPGDVNTASARVTLAEALAAAGDPIHARRHLLEAMSLRAQYLPADGYWRQYDNVRLAEIELAAGFPVLAVVTLAGAAVSTPWFGSRVSGRLWEEGAIVRAEALVACGEAGTALGLLDELPPGDRGAGRARAAALLALGRPEEAADVLARVAAAERALGDDFPGQARTFLLAARTADALGRTAASEESAAALQALAGTRLDEHHPAVLAGRLDTAARRAATGAIGEAAELLEPLLSRIPLDHARPALAEGNPLLTEARVLATRLGAPVPAASTAQLWEDI
ncbi:hypothetical protein [Nonomuraea typhae]|uniref:hypothetical protein n=1 Tax=Nonomuraea typhae TaxID=2603600 RepID=UPI0012FC8C65|nr:hypothetical protein [Nonomuraea typhae]